MLRDPDPALRRLARVVRHLEGLDEAAPAMARAQPLVQRLARRLLAEERAGDATAPDAADAERAFAPCPAAVSPERLRWHRTQAKLFLHYGPVAADLWAPASRPGERASALLLPDLLALAALHAEALDRDPAPFRSALPPQPPFAALMVGPSLLRSAASADVNLGAVALALAIESALRAALDIPAGERIALWRLFRAMAGETRGSDTTRRLVLLYNWASKHRSAGTRGFGWLNFFACDLLQPILAHPLGGPIAPDARLRLRDAALGQVALGPADFGQTARALAVAA